MNRLRTFASRMTLLAAIGIFCISCGDPMPSVPHAVVYDANGATSGTVPVDETLYLVNDPVTVMGNTGGLGLEDMLFGGWNTRADGSGTSYAEGQTLAMPGEELRLFARWTTPATYALSFDPNGATSGTAPAASSHQGGASVTLPLNTGNLTKNGYGLLGWNTAADGKGIAYGLGSTFVMPSAATTLYAQWGVNHRVIFVANGGTGSMAAQTIPEGGRAPLSPIAFTHGSASFAGWAATEHSTTISYAEGAEFTMGNADVMLYAVWKTWYAYTLSGSDATITGFSSDWDGTTAIAIPSYIGVNKVVAIAANAFRDKTTLASVAIPNTVTTIGEGAFYGCSALTSVNLGTSLKSVSSYCFQSCAKLASIVIPNSVVSIGTQAFAWCTALSSVTLGSGLTTIERCAFYDSPLLTSMTIPASVTSLDPEFIYFCSGFASLTVNAANTVYASDNGILYNKAKTKLVKCPVAKAGTVSVLAGTTEVAEKAFSDCGSLTGISLPSSLTTIGNYAFDDCVGLTSLNLPSNLASIAAYAFRGCTGLTGIALPASLLTFKEGVFQDCSSFATITVAAANTAFSVDSGVLFNKDKTSLVLYPRGRAGTSYSIPGTVKVIEATAFEQANLTSITIPSSVTEIKHTAFASSKLTSIVIPSSVTTIGNYIFSSCRSLTTLTVQATTPPAVGLYILNNSSAAIRVPAGSLASYKAAANWSNYADRMTGY